MKLTRHNRRGFTLVELLVVISILAMLSSMLLGALYAAQESARHTKTKTTIDKIQGIILLHWDGYQTRRVPVRMTNYERDEDQSGNVGIQLFARRQLLTRWQLMRVELPDRYEDINLNVVHANFSNLDYSPSEGSGGTNTRLSLSANSLKIGYRAAIQAAGYDPDDSDDILELSSENQSSECLYLIVKYGLDPEGDVRFLDSEVGDTDGDRMPEFLDGWGRPIQFIRWPTAFPSLIQAVPDPFDPMETNPDAPQFNPGNPQVSQQHALVPLIASGGPDGETALNFVSVDYDVEAHRRPWLDDDANRGQATTGLEGGGPEDNIHNHFVEISK